MHKFKSELLKWSVLNIIFLCILLSIPIIANWFNEIFSVMKVDLPMITNAFTAFSRILPSNVLYYPTVFFSVLIVWCSGIRIVGIHVNKISNENTEEITNVKNSIGYGLNMLIMLVVGILVMLFIAVIWPIIKLTDFGAS